MSTDPDWKRKEKIVAAIESRLGNGAKVLWNQQLRVLASKSARKRQCDVVVIHGEAPRQTTSIIEVQKRGCKPTIGEFGGWLEKMREVGAQHLICVSEEGFPASIEEKADEVGPTVRLLTLKGLDQGKLEGIGFEAHPKLQNVRYDKVEGLMIEPLHPMRIDPSKPQGEMPSPFEKIFRQADGKKLSINDLLDWHFFGNPRNTAELPRNEEIVVSVNFEGWEPFKGLEYNSFADSWAHLKKLTINIRLLISEHEIDWSAETYEQVKWGEVAWAVRGRAEVSGQDFDLISPLIKDANGQYRLQRPVTISEHDAFFAIGDIGGMATKLHEL